MYTSDIEGKRVKWTKSFVAEHHRGNKVDLKGRTGVVTKASEAAATFIDDNPEDYELVEDGVVRLPYEVLDQYENYWNVEYWLNDWTEVVEE